MHKKSSFNPRDKKSTGSSFKKDSSRGSSYGKKPYNTNSSGDDAGGDKPKRSFRDDAPREGGRFEKKEGYQKKSKDSGAYWKDKSGDKPSFTPRQYGEKRASDFKKDETDRPSRKPYGSDRPQRGGDSDAPRGRKPFGERDDRGGSDRAPRKDFSRGEGAGRKPFGERGGSEDRPKRDFTKGEGAGRKPFGERGGSEDRPKRDFTKGDGAGRKPFGERGGSEDRPRKENTRREGTGDRPFSKEIPSGDKQSSRAGKRPFPARDNGDARPARKEFGKGPRKDDGARAPRSRPYSGRPDSTEGSGTEKRETPADFYTKKNKPYTPAENRYLEDDDEEWEFVEDKKNKKKKQVTAATYPMPLNKFIAHSGECSRRDAAELVRQGKAKVNGELVVDPGHKINEEDKVTLSGKKLTPQKGRVYILLNKPKGFITTTDDPQGRRTVMDLVASADVGRVFPIGRLDRATTGLILLTNDGDLAQKLSHPSHHMKKVYHVTLDKRLTQADFDKIMEGMELEDGKAIVDEMAFLENNTEVGLEIHSGKNRIVRRIFESLGYVVEKLDRVMYAGLTKKNLPRSKWRFLDEREIVLLKHFKV